MRAARRNLDAKERPCGTGPSARALDPLTMRGGRLSQSRQQTVSLPPSVEAVIATRSRRAKMAAEYPIREDLVEAFCTAIMAFDDWKRGGSEPQVFLDGTFLPVSAIANFVSKFNDPMPDGITDFLCR